jgi:hypothetical protein
MPQAAGAARMSESYVLTIIQDAMSVTLKYVKSAR